MHQIVSILNESVYLNTSLHYGRWSHLAHQFKKSFRQVLSLNCFSLQFEVWFTLKDLNFSLQVFVFSLDTHLYIHEFTFQLIQFLCHKEFEVESSLLSVTVILFLLLIILQRFIWFKVFTFQFYHSVAINQLLIEDLKVLINLILTNL